MSYSSRFHTFPYRLIYIFFYFLNTLAIPSIVCVCVCVCVCVRVVLYGIVQAIVYISL